MELEKKFCLIWMKNGKFANYVRDMMNLSKDVPLNMWSVTNLLTGTLGNWKVPQQLNLLKNLLSDPSPEVTKILYPLYNVKNPWLKQDWKMPLINGDAWQQIVDTGGYEELKIWDPKSNIIAIGGLDDVICSAEGLAELQNKHRKSFHLYLVDNATHLFPLSLYKETNHILEKIITCL